MGADRACLRGVGRIEGDDIETLHEHRVGYLGCKTGKGFSASRRRRDRQSGHRVIGVSSAESPFGLKTISFLDLSLMYAVLDV